MTILTVIAVIWALASICLWIWAATKRSHFQQLLSRDIDTLVPWGLIDVYVIFVMCYVVAPLLYQFGFAPLDRANSTANVTAQVVGQTDLGTEDPVEAQADAEALDAANASKKTGKTRRSPEEIRKTMISSAWIRFIAIILSVLYVYGRHRATVAELGFTFNHFVRHAASGIVGAIMLIPPVMLLHTLVSQLVKYEHSTIDQLTSETFVAAFVSAGIAAPIFEEFFFRGILQGFLQRWGLLGNRNLKQVVLGGRPDASTDTFAANSWGEVNSANTPIWPIVASAAIFASMHIGQGAAFIPLFFFAIGLGYIFWRTHSLIPCIMIHLILNVWSLIFVLVQLKSGS